MNGIIELDHVSKIYKIPHLKTDNLKTYLLHLRKMRKKEIFYALKNIDLKIGPGQFIGIIGRNGSGKSTLLKIISNIIIPTTGEVTVRGKISPFLELGVGFNPELSARENIYLYSAILGLTKKQILDCYSDIIAFSELEKFIDMPVKNFSSGMLVRLAFSVAIQSNAPILLVDEVLAVGDAPFQEKCFNVFRDFKENGKTIVFVSHDMDSVANFCDRVFYLKKGEEMAAGKPEEMINRYQKDIGVH